MTRLAIIGAGKAAVIHGESARAVGGIKLIGIGGRCSGRAGAVASALGCEELTVEDLVGRADILVVAVPPGDTDEVLARIPVNRPLIVEAPVTMASATDSAHRHATDRPKAMLGANLLHAPLVRDGLAAVSGLSDPHHLVLRANGVRPRWHRVAGDECGVILDLGARLLPVLLAAAGKPVIEVSAKLAHKDGYVRAAELDLRLPDDRLVRAELHWGDDPPAAEIEAASATGVVAVGLWPFPVLEVDGNETASARGQEPLHALGFVPQLQRLRAVSEQRARPWPGLATGVGALRVIEAAMLSGSSGVPVRLG